MKTFTCSLICSFAVLTSSAFAGEVTGGITVKAPEGADAAKAAESKDKPVVVWIEGLEKFEVPKETPEISQKDAQFAPGFVVVVVGQTVNMPNNDNIAHNVFSFSPTKKFNLGIYPKGESKSVTFDQPGVVEVFCSIHRNMNAKIVVVPNPCFAQAKPGEAYKIKDVPPGSYTVKAWHEGHVCAEQKVTVPETGEVKLDLTFEPEKAQ